MTATAPSVAPAESPSVSGEASGLRRNAWNTTPATARLLPTRIAASTRGRRATKKTWASTLSANGMLRSRTRDKWIDVEPTSGAATQITSVSAPKPATVATIRRRRSVCARKRHDHRMPRARVIDDLGVDVVERADVRRRQHAPGLAGGDHTARPQHDDRAAERGRQVQDVRRY